MLKYKSHCPVCNEEIVVDVLHGKIHAPCGHRLRVRAKRNGWISCIFSFFVVITATKFTHPFFEKIPMGAVVELALSLLLVVFIIMILYKLFGFDNVYHVEERK